MSFPAVRDSLANQVGVMAEEQRELLTESLDTWLAQLFDSAVEELKVEPSDFALLTVGSYGRREPTLRSDLDIILLHQPKAQNVDKVAAALWYPIWDSGVALDHSVRTISQARHLAAHDLKVSMGLLDTRLVSGNSELSTRLIQEVHSDWRKLSGKMLPELRQLVVHRRSTSGDLFQLLEPDIKDSYGGLRDVTILRALGATWRVEIGQTTWRDSVQLLLNVRSSIHFRSHSDRLRLQDQPEIALELGFHTAEELLRAVYLAGRDIAYASDRAWNQLEKSKDKKDIRRPLAEGVVAHGGEVVLAKASVSRLLSESEIIDLTLSVGAASSIAELPISPALLAKLTEPTAPLAQQWTPKMRDSFVQILGSRFGMLSTWESLDQFHLISPWFPEWEHVRSLPQFNSLHEFTVDRHLIECVLQGQGLTRTVKRPDLLLVACLLHDIGKGLHGDHSIVGAQMARRVMSRMGFQEQDIHAVELLVLHHLLLADMATRRDLDDAVVIESLCAQLESRDHIELLLALSLADSRATGPSLRSQWRENLITEAAQRAILRLAGEVLEQRFDQFDGSQFSVDPDGLIFNSTRDSDGYRVVIGFPDQIGLLAAVAGVFAIHKLQVRAADLHEDREKAVQMWNVRPLFGEFPDVDVLRRDIKRAISGDLNLADRLARSHVLDPTLFVHLSRVSDQQTVLEVRARDRKALLYDIAQVISSCGMTITGARISTLGLDAVDVFFIQNALGLSPTEEEGQLVTTAIENQLKS